ncbi:MAG: hypothetical protein M0R50_03290 [Candidatus Cloacimonetes bacterium]|jgi:hypothetical protein|nr:hypothetical protein [Candidatus Cloacimonadota bacterium]
MDITRIASIISEQIDNRPQELLNSYIKSSDSFKFEDFDNYCRACGIDIAEDTFIEMLANNDKYLFTESDGYWIPTLLDELEEILDV